MRRLNVLAMCLILVACGDETTAPTADAGPPPQSVAFAVATDYFSAGVATAIELPSLAVHQNVAAGVASTDPVVRHFGGKLYIVNRFGHDNVTILDAASYELLAQISTGAGSNPQDVAVVGTTLYLPALGSAGVVVLDEADPGAPPDLVDLSALDPADGLPDCTSIEVVDETLYVACGMLDETFAPRGPGRVVTIEQGGSVGPAVELAFANPVGRLVRGPVDSPLEGDLLIATVPDFSAPSAGGCVERLRPGAELEALGCLVDNAALGGYASAYEYGAGKVWIAVSASFTEARLLRFDMGGGLEAQPRSPAAQQVTDLAVCPSGDLVVNDLAGGGLRVYRPDGGELTTAVLDLGQPPILGGGIVCY